MKIGGIFRDFEAESGAHSISGVRCPVRTGNLNTHKPLQYANECRLWCGIIREELDNHGCVKIALKGPSATHVIQIL